MKHSKNLIKSLAVVMPALVGNQLLAAPAFDPSEQPLASIAPIELSTTNLVSGAKAYRTWFENGGWQGDLVEYSVAADGSLTTSVDLTGTSPANPGANPANWSAHVQFAAAETAAADYWDTGREIITWDSAAESQVAFRWGNLSNTTKEALDEGAFSNNLSESDILDFLRGDRSEENPAGDLRQRFSILGDIIRSNPTFVGPPSESFTENGYASSFAKVHEGREKRIYVGANDGMLHAFDAANGKEAWAYVPSMLIGDMTALAARPFSHWYGVDGLITAKDAYDDGWFTALVGGLGAGGKGWYGLDITYPDLDETSKTGKNAKVLWELDGTTDDDLGYSYGQAVITQLNDGKWYAVLGNGYNSKNGLAKLYVVPIKDGDKENGVLRLSTGSGSDASPNGLSAPTLVDRNRDGKADYAYAGDIDGNLWKFDLTSTDSTKWKVDFAGKPLHAGSAFQPILEAPDVTLHPLSGFLVYFGTGRLFTRDDLGDNSTQALYGIWDRVGSTPPTAAEQELLTQTLSGDVNFTATGISEIVQTIDPDTYLAWNIYDGWKIEFPRGFRMLSAPQLRGGRVKATLHNPNTRDNYVLEAYFGDGGSPGTPIFDLNQDDNLTVADNVDGNTDGDIEDNEDVVVLWLQSNGLMSQTTVGRVANGIDAQILNILIPPIPEAGCTGNCIAGFQGGHVDVDTDYFDDGDGVGGDTYKHTHEYDKDTGRVYIDYQDHGPVAGHAEIDVPSYLPTGDQWIVVVSNADLSPGSTLGIDGRQYNIVDYQIMIQKKLRGWKYGTPLRDDSNRNLIFSAAGLASSGGTVRHDFTDMAILAGGLHPTRTGCVNNGDSVTKGRYRNGALVTQFVNLSVFAGCNGDCLDRVIVQQPADLKDRVISRGNTYYLSQDLDGSGSAEAANYEIFGGVRGFSGGGGNKDVLFESTLFWHYPGDSCYGEDGWIADVAAERGMTQEEFDAILEANGIIDLDQELADHEYCKGDDGKKTKKKGDKDDGGTGGDGTCADYYALLAGLIATRDAGLIGSPTPDGDPTGLESDGTAPVTMGGEAGNLGVTAGPNFEVGRRTWTDIFDD